MNYEDLKIKEELIGKFITDCGKTIELSNELPTSTKRYIYNMITKNVFDIYKKEVVIEQTIEQVIEDIKDIEIIEVKNTIIEDKMITVEQPKKKRGRNLKHKNN